jgi:hypothetical protein
MIVSLKVLMIKKWPVKQSMENKKNVGISKKLWMIGCNEVWMK